MWSAFRHKGDVMFQRVRVPKLESDRLLLRGWSKRDAADLYEYASDPLVGPAAGWAPHRNQSESRMIIDQIYTTKLDWAIVDKSSNKPIGNIGLDDDGIRSRTNSKELGYSVGSKYWGNGIATEAVNLVKAYAFDELGLYCISMRIETDNMASKRVAEKTGFKYEGTLRQAYRRYDNETVDMACYSILDSDYYGWE